MRKPTSYASTCECRGAKRASRYIAKVRFWAAVSSIGIVYSPVGTHEKLEVGEDTFGPHGPAFMTACVPVGADPP